MDWIRAETGRNGYAPNLRELAGAFGIRSTHGVLGHRKALERHGLIRRQPGKARSIVVVGSATCPSCGQDCAAASRPAAGSGTA